MHFTPAVTPTQYVVNTLYWPHTALSVYLVCYFLVPHTHVLCMGSGSATGKKFQVRLVHSLLKYFFKFQLWYWIKNLHYQIFKFVIDNSDISLNCLQHIQKRRNFDAKVTCHQPICLLLHAILSGVGVPAVTRTIYRAVHAQAALYSIGLRPGAKLQCKHLILNRLNPFHMRFWNLNRLCTGSTRFP